MVDSIRQSRGIGVVKRAGQPRMVERRRDKKRDNEQEEDSSQSGQEATSSDTKETAPETSPEEDARTIIEQDEGKPTGRRIDVRI